MSSATNLRPSPPTGDFYSRPGEIVSDQFQEKDSMLWCWSSNPGNQKILRGSVTRSRSPNLRRYGYVLTRPIIRIGISTDKAIEYSTKELSSEESRVHQEILSYGQFDNDWDGDGAKAPSSEAVNDALVFLRNRPIDIPLPSPECGTEGDIGFYWDDSANQVFTEVSFEGDGTYAYFAVCGIPGAIIEKCGGDDIAVAMLWPGNMLRILRKINPT